MRKTEGSGDMLPQENVKFRSSEMAKNASKTVNSNVKFTIIIKTTSYNLALVFDQD